MRHDPSQERLGANKRNASIGESLWSVMQKGPAKSLPFPISLSKCHLLRSRPPNSRLTASAFSVSVSGSVAIIARAAAKLPAGGSGFSSTASSEASSAPCFRRFPGSLVQTLVQTAESLDVTSSVSITSNPRASASEAEGCWFDSRREHFSRASHDGVRVLIPACRT